MILVLALVTATLQPASPKVGDLITVRVYHFTSDLRDNAHESFRRQAVQGGHDRLAAGTGIGGHLLYRQFLSERVFRPDQPADQQFVDLVLLVHDEIPFTGTPWNPYKPEC